MAFCFWDNQTFTGVLIPIASGACVLLIWEIVSRVKAKKEKEREKQV
jgi:hypothetical protein